MKITQKIFSFFTILCTLFLMGCEIFDEKNSEFPVLELPKAKIQIGNQEFEVELADTPVARRTGLMFREKLDKETGMIFEFKQESIQEFWMKNTLIPLDIIWISAENKVVDFRTMIPCEHDPCKLYSSEQKAKFVLEINAGEFEGKQGDKLILTK